MRAKEGGGRGGGGLPHEVGLGYMLEGTLGARLRRGYITGMEVIVTVLAFWKGG